MVEKKNMKKNVESKTSTLLEERDLYQFAKLAYSKPGQKDFADRIVKKVLKEGRGATSDPTEKDQRFQNLKERNELEEVKLGEEEVNEGQEELDEDLGNVKKIDKPQAFKGIAPQKGKSDQLKENEVQEEVDEEKLNEGEMEEEVNEGQEELDEDLGNVKKIDKPQAFKGIAPQKGKSDQLKEGAGVSFKHPPKLKLAENEEEIEMGNPVDMAGPGPEPSDHIEPDGDEGGQGLGDVSALVADLAKVIQQHTGVSIDVEGAGAPSPDDLGNEPENEPTPPMPPDTEGDQGLEAHKASGQEDEYEEELDEMAGSMPSSVSNVQSKMNNMNNQMRMRESHGKDTKDPNQMQESKKQRITNELVEKITKNVLAKLAGKKISKPMVNKSVSRGIPIGNKQNVQTKQVVMKGKKK